QSKVEEEVQAVTVVHDRIGEAAAAHRVHPYHLTTVSRDHLRSALDDRSRLLVADIRVDDNAELIVSCHLWHAVSSFGVAPTEGSRTRMCCAYRWGRMDGVWDPHVTGYLFTSSQDPFDGDDCLHGMRHRRLVEPPSHYSIASKPAQ